MTIFSFAGGLLGECGERYTYTYYLDFKVTLTRVGAKGIRFDEEIKEGASLDIMSIAKIETQERYYTPI